MTAVPAALAKALAQLGSRAVIGVAAKSIAVTLVLLAAAGTGLYWGLAELASRYGFASGWASLGAAVLLPVLVWLLFRMTAMAVLPLFADEIVAAVEARHYPALAARAQPLPLASELAQGARSLARVIGYNLLALPLALALVFTAIGPAAVFLLVNAVLLGREFTDPVWARHRASSGGIAGAGAPHPVPPFERLLLGAVMAGVMLVPLLGLLAPVIGTAAGTHLVLRRLEQTERDA